MIDAKTVVVEFRKPDGANASFVQRSLSMFQSFIGSWLPLALIFLATWVTGTLRTNGHAGHVV